MEFKNKALSKKSLLKCTIWPSLFLTIKSKHFFQKKKFVKKKVGQKKFSAKQILIKQILVEKEI